MADNELAWHDLRLLAQQQPRAVSLAFFSSRRASSRLYEVYGVCPSPHHRQKLLLSVFALLTAAVDDGLLAAGPSWSPCVWQRECCRTRYEVLSDDENASHARIGRRVFGLCEAYQAQERRSAQT